MGSKTLEQFWEATLTPEESKRLDEIIINDLGFGYDIFGLNKDWMKTAYAVVKLFYEKYFRVESTGIENIPTKGRVILASNHSGGIPIDGAMIIMDVATKMNPPRLVRAIVDNFAAAMPFVGLFFYRVGQVVGHRKNFEVLLQNEEAILVFPGGTKDIGRLFKERYNPARFNVGFIELSLIYKAPIVPVAVVGAEEQLPVLYKWEKLGQIFGSPYFPVTPQFFLYGGGPLTNFIPFPSKYHIYYGEPLEYYKYFSEDTVENPEMVQTLAADVRSKVVELIQRGLKERKGVFY